MSEDIITCPLCKSDNVFGEDVTVYFMEHCNKPKPKLTPSPLLYINYCGDCGFAGEFDEMNLLIENILTEAKET